MPEADSSTKCFWIACDNPGKLRCTRCRDATPQTLYCSAKCQKKDWMFHKAFCGKKAYTFDITLVGSSSPSITRTVAVPAWFTFRQLHYTLQYAMGPWQHMHMHEFSFNRLFSEFESPTRPGYWVRNEIDRGPRRLDTLAARDERLKVGPKELYDDDELDNWHPMLGRPPKKAPKEREESLRLEEVFDRNGRLYGTVAKDGDMYPLIYTYDFGDNWEHELIFKGETLARAARPLFSFAQGCGPVEDCGGPEGWDEVKAAYRTPLAARTKEHKELLEWAKRVSGLGEQFDPLKDPNVTQMNYEGRWENHVEAYMRACGDPALPKCPRDEDGFEDEEDEVIVL